MTVIDTAFVMDLESRMRLITEAEYVRMAQSDVLWWDEVTKLVQSSSRREIIHWILSTAFIEDQGPLGGKMDFEDMTILDHEISHRHAGKGLKLHKSQFKDLDGNGVRLAAEWSQQMGAQHGYWPQRQVATLLKAGETNVGYDGVPFFATNHPVHPYRPASGTFSNLLAGAQYRIDHGVPMETAFVNLANVFAHIAGLKMPNGSDPRFLRPELILAPPTMKARVNALLGAKFLAMSASSGGGSTDISGVIEGLGFARPKYADELSGFEGETSYFVFAKEIAASELGAFAYSPREPFAIRYYTGDGGGAVGVDAILDRTDELEWHTKGRNATAYGHPYHCFKVKAA